MEDKLIWKDCECLSCNKIFYDKITCYHNTYFIGGEFCSECLKRIFKDSLWEDPVNNILSNWDSNLYHIDLPQVSFMLFNKYYFLPNTLISNFYKLKACICATLNLHNRPNNSYGISLDFYGSFSSTPDGNEWKEYGYEIGEGFFSNWWITEI